MFILGHLGLTAGLLILILILSKQTERIRSIDFRLFFILAILADIIDKTIGHLLFPDSLNNGRLFSHTLVFLILFSFLIYLKTRSSWWIYSLPLITHQIFDLLFLDLDTWLWPAFGWEFEVFDKNVWENWIYALTNDPYIITTEIVGGIILIYFIFRFQLYKIEKIRIFIRNGDVGGK